MIYLHFLRTFIFLINNNLHFNRIQPVLDTQRQQIKIWCSLILDYFQFYKIHEIEIQGAVLSFDLFNNTKINRRLNTSDIYFFIERLVEQGNAKWVNKNKQRAKIIWKTSKQWADIIYNYITTNSLFNVVCSLYELRESDQVEKEEFYNLEIEMFIEALKEIEKKGLCVIFSGNNQENIGVKFLNTK